jgi:hypothetical protein
MYSHRELVRDISCYSTDLVRVYRQLSESAHILAVMIVRTDGRLSEYRHVFHPLPFLIVILEPFTRGMKSVSFR